jgi:inorganic diphosphatase
MERQAFVSGRKGQNKRGIIIRQGGKQMSNIWHDMSPSRIAPDDFLAVVEIQKGSKKKYELDKETGMLRLDRILYTSTHYPANYGFIPLTYADDNDPLDVLILSSQSIDPMVLVRCYPIGVIKMVDNDYMDEKIIAIPFSDPMYNSYKDIHELPAHVSDEMMHFFSVYKALENMSTAVQEVMDGEEARRIIKEALKRYGVHFAPGVKV